MIAEKLKTANFYVLAVLLVFFISPKAQAQLSKISKTINEGADMIRSVGRLVDATKRTSAEFNKNVKVVKGNPTPSTPTRGTGTGTNTTPPPPAPVPVVGKPTEPKFKNGKFTNFVWEPVSYFDGQLFPSCIICMSTYKGSMTPMLRR